MIQYYRITIHGQKPELQDFCRDYNQAFTCIGVSSFTDSEVSFTAIADSEFVGSGVDNPLLDNRVFCWNKITEQDWMDGK